MLLILLPEDHHLENLAWCGLAVFSPISFILDWDILACAIVNPGFEILLNFIFSSFSFIYIIPVFIAVIFKEWTPDHNHGHHMRTANSGTHPALLNQKFWGWSSAIWGWASPRVILVQSVWQPQLCSLLDSLLLGNKNFFFFFFFCCYKFLSISLE